MKLLRKFLTSHSAIQPSPPTHGRPSVGRLLDHIGAGDGVDSNLPVKLVQQPDAHWTRCGAVVVGLFSFCCVPRNGREVVVILDPKTKASVSFFFGGNIVIPENKRFLGHSGKREKTVVS